MYKINLKSVFVFFVYVFAIILTFLSLCVLNDLAIDVNSLDISDHSKSICLSFGFLAACDVFALAYLSLDFAHFLLFLKKRFFNKS